MRGDAYLSLSSNQIGDAGITSLADAVSKGVLDKLTVCWRPTALSLRLGMKESYMYRNARRSMVLVGRVG